MGILGASSMLAEESGWFAGAHFGMDGVQTDYRYYLNYGSTDTNMGQAGDYYDDPQNQSFDGYKFGFLGGYKQFFTPKFGLRYYSYIDFGMYEYEGTAYTLDASAGSEPTPRAHFTNKLNKYAFGINVDALYNFISNETWDFGVFGGLNFGYVIYKYKMRDGTNDALGLGEYMLGEKMGEGSGYSQIDIVRDFDIGINFGLRANVAKRHGIELVASFGLLEQKETFIPRVFFTNTSSQGNTSTTHTPSFEPVTLTSKQNMSLALRYIFSF